MIINDIKLWIEYHRGDTIYDVLFPKDVEIICCDKEKGIFRTNKIIIANPKVITDEIIKEIYNMLLNIKNSN